MYDPKRLTYDLRGHGVQLSCILAGVDCDTLEVHKIECKDRGPLQEVKGCRNFVGPKQVTCLTPISICGAEKGNLSDIYQHMPERLILYDEVSRKFYLNHCSYK